MEVKAKAQYVEDGSYILQDGRVICRDHDGLTPNGNPLAGRWALRDKVGTLIDFDKYISDLAERHQIDLQLGSRFNSCQERVAFVD